MLKIDSSNARPCNRSGLTTSHHTFATATTRACRVLLILIGILTLTTTQLQAEKQKQEKTSDSKSEDSSSGFYDPIERNIEGWTILVDPLLLNEENKEFGKKVLKALANHLQRITYIVPEDKVKTLRTMRIWIEFDNRALSNMQYHPGVKWLKDNGHDPRLVKHVHLPRAKQLLDRHMWAKHPYVVLHELAHAYHDQILDFKNPEIAAIYRAAKDSGTYDKVLPYKGRKVRHYGLNNPMEYFAEATEAYFGVNDFYPFVRAELKEHDPRMYAHLVKIWGRVE